METKEFKIQVPEGYEIDKENSTFDCINDNNNNTYCDIEHEIVNTIGSTSVLCNVYSKEQGEKLIAISRLMNVAKHLNGDWKPDFDKGLDAELKFFIAKTNKDELIICHVQCTNDINVYFKSRKLAKQAIKILGEQTIKTALSTDW